LVLCTGNSCRSQIAEGYLKYFARDKADVYSAGIEVHGLNPKAVETMFEDGIDISAQTSNNIDEYQQIEFDFIITVCDHAKESCPHFPARSKRFHQSFPDPAKAQGTEVEVREEFRKVREQIRNYCKLFIAGNL